MDHFGDAYGGDADMIALGNRIVYKIGGSFPQARIRVKIPDCRVGVGYGDDH
jgi:hypothetical protein